MPKRYKNSYKFKFFNSLLRSLEVLKTLRDFIIMYHRTLNPKILQLQFFKIDLSRTDHKGREFKILESQNI